MPVHNLCFRASCGQFLTTFLRLHDWTSQLCRQSAKASDHSKKQTWCLVVSVCGQILIVLWRRGNESWAYGRSSGTTPSARRSSRQHTRWTKSSDLQGDAPDGPNEVIFKTTHQMDQIKCSQTLVLLGNVQRIQTSHLTWQHRFWKRYDSRMESFSHWKRTWVL